MNKKEKRTIVLNIDDYEWLKLLENEQIGRLFLTVYKKYRSEKFDVTNDIRVPFTVITTSVDQYNERWKAECLRRSEAGKKGNLVRWKSQSIANVADKEMDMEMEKEILEIKKVFLFSKLICPVNAEFARFWLYYEKNDWVDGKGIPITNRLACAKNWKPDFSSGKIDVRLAKAWKAIFKLLRERKKSELMITDLFGFNLKNDVLIILCTSQLYDFIESNVDDAVAATIRKWFGCQKVEYKIVANNEEQ